MRELHDHKTNGCNNEITIKVIDEPGPGGACHAYNIDGPIEKFRSEQAPKFRCAIRFQKGPIGEVGVNGITSEALLAVLIDRHRGFASGPYPSRDNAIALTHMEDALLRLQNRTNDRIRRGVEGKMEK